MGRQKQPRATVITRMPKRASSTRDGNVISARHHLWMAELACLSDLAHTNDGDRGRIHIRPPVLTRAGQPHAGLIDRNFARR